MEENIRRGAYHFIQRALVELEDSIQDDWEWHHRRLFTWMKAIVATDESHVAPQNGDINEDFLDQLDAHGGAAGQLVCRVGAKLVDIVQQKVTPLELMTEGGLLGQYYEQLPCNVRGYQQLRVVISLFAAKNPGARVLEIGAGTGGATSTVLSALSMDRGNSERHEGDGEDNERTPSFAQYDFTDVSAGFFDAARRKFVAWEGRMNFKRLDIGADPETQQPDFGPDSLGSYDLVVASLVLHATARLDRTLSHVRKLLRPGGTLVMLECTQDRLDSQLVFGTLPGWWLGEEPGRFMSPNASLATWDRVLRNTGFRGVEFDIADCEDPRYQSLSIIVSTATTLKPGYPKAFTLVYQDGIMPPDNWVARLRGIGSVAYRQ